jgi:hypothetical protein
MAALVAEVTAVAAATAEAEVALAAAAVHRVVADKI